MKFAMTLAVLTAIAGCASAPPDDPRLLAERYRDAIVSPIRTDQDRRMDAVRRPVQFLPFTQVRPGMRVLDVSAGAGYTSQLLALAVGADGKVWAQTPQLRPALAERLAAKPQSNLVAAVRPFDDPVPDEAAGLDLVTIVLNYHDIAFLPVDRAKMNARLYAALKPGGHLIVVDHAARNGSGVADARPLHRIDEAAVRSELQAAGFRLEAEGDFLRNPDDARDQPSFNAKIPTDKFALRFVKPG